MCPDRRQVSRVLLACSRSKQAQPVSPGHRVSPPLVDTAQARRRKILPLERTAEHPALTGCAPMTPPSDVRLSVGLRLLLHSGSV
ncbi:hypothetical protein STIAU_8295, partial [Stigmatella aurantiaca DW4/3-1]